MLPMSERYVLIAGCSAAESASEYWAGEGNSRIDHGDERTSCAKNYAHLRQVLLTEIFFNVSAPK